MLVASPDSIDSDPAPRRNGEADDISDRDLRQQGKLCADMGVVRKPSDNQITALTLTRHVPLPDASTTKSTSTSGTRSSLKTRGAQILRQETAGLHFRLLLARMVLAPLPIHVGGRLRSRVMGLFGFQIDPSAILAGMPTITGDGLIHKKLTIGSCCWINIRCLFDLGGEIKIGDNVSIGHDVLLLTVTHEIGASRHRASWPVVKNITIGNGVWIGSRSTILPGVTIGAGAVVAAGSVVHQDVSPDSLVGGVPARTIKKLR